MPMSCCSYISSSCGLRCVTLGGSKFGWPVSLEVPELMFSLLRVLSACRRLQATSGPKMGVWWRSPFCSPTSMVSEHWEPSATPPKPSPPSSIPSTSIPRAACAPPWVFSTSSTCPKPLYQHHPKSPSAKGPSFLRKEDVVHTSM